MYITRHGKDGSDDGRIKLVDELSTIASHSQLGPGVQKIQDKLPTQSDQADPPRALVRSVTRSGLAKFFL